MKPLRLFTPVWGADHLDWFRRGCVRSLMWPRNREALKGASWDIWTTQADRDSVLDIVAPLGIAPDIGIVNTNAGVNRGHELLQRLMVTWRKCVENGELFCLVMPDIIYGDGSWPVMVEMA